MRISEIFSLVVWCFACTEIPYSSSQTLITIGTCNTPAALIVSQNRPSLVLAFPMVPQATSFPLEDKWLKCSRPSTCLYIFDACASPRSLGICPAVGEMSALEFFSSDRFFQLPSWLMVGVAK